MPKQHLNLIKHAVNDKGFLITVDWGDDNEVVKSKSIKEIYEASEACDESVLVFYDEDGERKGWAYIVLGNDGGDEVSDYGICGWLDDWFDKWFEEYCN